MWAHTNFPLRDWAAGIEHARVWISDEQSICGIDVTVAGSGYSAGINLTQFAPMPVDWVDAIAPFAPPAVRMLAAAAPGLSLGSDGRLLIPDYLARPLHLARHWMRFQISHSDNDPNLTRALTELGTCTSFDVMVACAFLITWSTVDFARRSLMLTDSSGRTSNAPTVCWTTLSWASPVTNVVCWKAEPGTARARPPRAPGRARPRQPARRRGLALEDPRGGSLESWYERLGTCANHASK